MTSNPVSQPDATWAFVTGSLFSWALEWRTPGGAPCQPQKQRDLPTDPSPSLHSPLPSLASLGNTFFLRRLPAQEEGLRL